MLTADLLRVSDRKNIISPRYLKLSGKAAPKHLNRAQTLIALFQQYTGKTRRSLTEAIEDAVGDGTDFMTARGLAKLLDDRSEFETVAKAEPQVVREILFTLSAEHHPVLQEPEHDQLSRDAVLELACVKVLEHLRNAQGESDQHTLLGIKPPPLPELTPADIEEALYADHDDNQRLISFKTIDPEALLHRYNLALAQAVLYRAHAMRIRLHNTKATRFRQLFRFMKFYRLMHTARRIDTTTWELRLDGPMSLFQNTQKYGLQMALFLPALVLCDNWEMEAGLSWGPERAPRTFSLDSATSILVSHYPDKGIYVTDEQQNFEKGFNKLKSPWSISRNARVIPLGRKDVLVPDLVFRHKTDGRTAMMEVIGYWRKAWLEARADALSAHGPSNLIVAASERMRTDPGKKKIDLGDKVHLYTFKGVILPKKILALLEEIAE